MNDEQTYSQRQNAQRIHQSDERLRPASDLAQYVRQYSRQRPEVVALWCFGIGFALGWKLKIW